MSWRRPKFVSERERAEIWVDGRTWDDQAWEDCGPTSTIMAVHATTGGHRPAVMTLDEAERLRRAAGYGPKGGTNIQQLAATAVSRYRINLPRHASGFEAIWAALRPGQGAVLAGSMAGFGPGHRLSRHLRSYNGGHAVYVQREGTASRVWWMDPLAPIGYEGEWASRDEVRLFLAHGIASAVIVPLTKVAA